MKEQPPEHRSRSRRASRSWEVAPCIDPKSQLQLVYVRYGGIEHYLPEGAAKGLVEAILDAMQHDKTTTYEKPTGRIL